MEVCQVLVLWSIVWSRQYRMHCVSIWKQMVQKRYFTILRFSNLELFFWIFLKELFFNFVFGQDSRISDFGEPNIFFAPFMNFKWPIVVCRLQRFFFLWNVCKQHSMVHKFSAIRVEYSFTTPPSITNPMHKLLP